MSSNQIRSTRVVEQRIEHADAVRPAQWNRAGPRDLAQPKCRARLHDVRQPLRPRAARQAAQEPPRLGAGDLEPQLETRLIRLHLAEPFNPAYRQLHLLLDDAVAAMHQRDFLATDAQFRFIICPQPPKRRPHCLIEINVRRPAPTDVAIECLGRQIRSRVNAATTAEPLEPQHPFVARYDRIGDRRPRLEEMRSDHLRQHRKHPAKNLRLTNAPTKELRMIKLHTARGQADGQTIAFLHLANVRRERITVCVIKHRSCGHVE